MSARIGAITLIVALLLTACSNQNDVAIQEPGLAEIVRQATPIPAVTILPTSRPAVKITPTTPPTIVATATEVPEIRLFAPEYLERNVLAAIGELESAGTNRRWRLVTSSDQVDVRLEPGGQAIPAGHRAIALTVPFDSDLEAITSDDANRIVNEGREGVANMDWALMPTQRRALRVDGLLPSDEGYTLLQEWSLVPAEGYETAASELAPYLRNYLHHDQVIQLTAVGDLMLDRAIGYALRNGDLSFPFGAVNTALEQADLTIGNLESALGDTGQPASKSYTFQAPPEAVDALALAGFDLVSLANNHAMDYGPEALRQALQLLNDGGIAIVGAGLNETLAREPFNYEVDGLKVALLGYVDVPVEVTGFDTRTWSATAADPGLAWADAAHISADVSNALLDSDVVVVILHSGYEYVQAPSPAQTAAAQAAINAGASLVIGHHAHILQGIALHDNSAIAYGLGNFAFEIDGDPTTMILNVWLDPEGVRQLELIPAIIQAGGRPRIAAPWEAFEIRQRVYYLSRTLSALP